MSSANPHLVHPLEDLPAVLGLRRPDQPLEVEIGCGNGHFITEYAERNPERFLLGVELKNQRCLKAVRKAERRGLDNVAIVHGKAEELLARLPAGGVAGFHLYFPDPWPKTKHRRRRFLRIPNLDLLAGLLQPGGRIHFCTDVFDYALQAKLLFILHPLFRLSPQEPLPETLLSVFGRKFIEGGREIHSVTGSRR